MSDSSKTTGNGCSGNRPVDFKDLALREGVIGYPVFPWVKKEGGPKLKPHGCGLLFDKLRT